MAVTKIIEVVGSSPESSDGAVKAALDVLRKQLPPAYPANPLEAYAAAPNDHVRMGLVTRIGESAADLLELAAVRELESREAMELAVESESINARAGALKLRAWIHEVRGELDAAEATYEESLELYGESGYRLGVGFTSSYLGKIRLRRDDARGAERHLREAVRILTTLGDRGNRCEAERLLAQALAAQGRLEVRLDGEYPFASEPGHVLGHRVVGFLGVLLRVGRCREGRQAAVAMLLEPERRVRAGEFAPEQRDLFVPGRLDLVFLVQAGDQALGKTRTVSARQLERSRFDFFGVY